MNRRRMKGKVYKKFFMTLFFVLILLFFSGCLRDISSNVDFSYNKTKNNNLLPLDLSLVQEDKSEINTSVLKDVLPKDEFLVDILSTNEDGKDFLAIHDEVRVVNKTKIFPQQFESLRTNTQFKEVFANLPNKELYYVEFSGGYSLNLMTVIDVDNKSVINIYGRMTVYMG